VDTLAGTVTVNVAKTAGHDQPFYPQSLERGRRSSRAVMLAVADGMPPPCAGLAFRGNALLLKRGLMDRIARGGDNHLVLSPDPARVKDADRPRFLYRGWSVAL